MAAMVTLARLYRLKGAGFVASWKLEGQHRTVQQYRDGWIPPREKRLTLLAQFFNEQLRNADLKDSFIERFTAKAEAAAPTTGDELDFDAAASCASSGPK